MVYADVILAGFAVFCLGIPIISTGTAEFIDAFVMGWTGKRLGGV